MSDNVENSAQPALADQVQELQAHFPSDAALQEAMAQLAMAGFDHAEISMPNANVATDTPDAADAAAGDVDRGNLRTMASSMAGAAAGMGVAGVLVATGGLAAPVVAALGGASAIGTIAATSGVSNAVDGAAAQARDELGAQGKLMLAVRVRSPELMAKAEAILRDTGGTQITGIADANLAQTRGVSSTSWTG